MWLGGKWHPELQADSEEADSACDLMPRIDPGSTAEDIREMTQGSLPLMVPASGREEGDFWCLWLQNLPAHTVCLVSLSTALLGLLYTRPDAQHLRKF